MFRVQLALRVPDLDASVAFYSKLFGTEVTWPSGFTEYCLE